MKKIIIVIAILLVPTLALADAGVIIEVKGNVSVTNLGGSKMPAKSGAELPDGATISTGKNSSAVIFFKNGQIKRLNAEQKFTAKKLPKKADETLFTGLSAAAKDAAKKERGATARMAIKKVELPKPARTPVVDQKALNEDLAKVEKLKLSPESTALLKAEVYNTYALYNRVVNILSPFCQPKTCTNSAAKNLIQTAYMKLGKVKLASDY